jgi:hypothetical protein
MFSISGTISTQVLPRSMLQKSAVPPFAPPVRTRSQFSAKVTLKVAAYGEGAGPIWRSTRFPRQSSTRPSAPPQELLARQLTLLVPAPLPWKRTISVSLAFAPVALLPSIGATAAPPKTVSMVRCQSAR